VRTFVIDHLALRYLGDRHHNGGDQGCLVLACRVSAHLVAAPYRGLLSNKMSPETSSRRAGIIVQPPLRSRMVAGMNCANYRRSRLTLRAIAPPACNRNCAELCGIAFATAAIQMESGNLRGP
jgi:hypothetical protein